MKNFKQYADKNNFKSTGKVDNDKANSRLRKLQRLRDTQRWRDLSVQIRDRWVICQYQFACGKPATSVHHIKEAYFNFDLFWRETNLIPLCEEHHRKYDNQSVYLDNKVFEYWYEKIDRYRKDGIKYD